MKKRIGSMLWVLCMLLGMMPLNTYAYEISKYDADDAVEYAEENWASEEGLCDEYVKDCLSAGGLTLRAGGVKPVKDALLDLGCGPLIKLNMDAKGVYINKVDNPNVSPGDVMFCYCSQCDVWVHIALVAGFDEAGNVEAYGHNPGWNRLTYFGNLTFKSNGVSHKEGMEFYVVNMNTTGTHSHDFEEDLYENDHPHKMYDWCEDCEAKYYLGWNAKLSTCTTCNPPIDTKPVVTVAVNANTAVELKWSTVEGAVNYVVERALSQDGTYFEIFSKMAVTMTNSSVNEGETYYYRVTAVLSDGTKMTSDIVSCTIPGGVVEKPSLTGTIADDGSVKLSWTKVLGATRYDVLRAKSKDGSYFTLNTIQGTTFTNASASVKTGVKYFYKVKAYLANGNTLESDVVSCQKQIVLSDLKAEGIGPNKVKLTWNASEGADGYLIYGQKNGKYGYVGMTTMGTTFTDKKAMAIDYNFYWVFPYVKEEGIMHTSGCPKYVYAKGICAAPTNFKAASVKDGVKLTWNASEGADGYLIYGIVNDKAYGYVGMTTKGTTFTDKKASKDVWNFYWVFPCHNEYVNGVSKIITGYIPKYVWGKAK